MARGEHRVARAALMQRIAECLAEAGNAEAGLARAVPLLSRFLKADLGVFLVRKNAGWMIAAHGADEAFCRTLPRAPRIAARTGPVALSAVHGGTPSGGGNGAGPPDAVVIPVRVGRRRLGYGVFRTGADNLPSRETLLLLDVVGAHVAAFCETVSRNERAKTDLDHLACSNRDLAWLLRFGEALHALNDPDTMFKWLCRELGETAPVLGVELLSLSEGPFVRIGTDLATRVSAKRDGIAIVKEWSEALASRYRILVPEGEFRLKRFPCLPVAEHGHPCGNTPGVRRVETPLNHAGRILGVLAAYLPAGPGEDRRIDRLIESAAGQVGLFLHKHADGEKIRFLANHDALTGLLNHWSFQNIFEREFERHRRHDRNLSLLFVDIDHFKRINDEYGHQAGDRVLREIARILTANLRKIDYVFRYGGDEFVVLMTETDSQRASMLAHRIRGAVKREAGGIAPSRLPVSISIGIADCGDLTQAEREELLFRADVALYQAKNGGRDRIRVADRPLDCALRVN